MCNEQAQGSTSMEVGIVTCEGGEERGLVTRYLVLDSREVGTATCNLLSQDKHYMRKCYGVWVNGTNMQTYYLV
jgi:hypothetical protein